MRQQARGVYRQTADNIEDSELLVQRPVLRVVA